MGIRISRAITSDWSRSHLACRVHGGAGVASAQDVVITTSGDRLVGEIKSVEKDVLTLSTDYSDSDFKIEWGKIASIESKRQFLVETFDGKRLSGSLTLDPEKKPVVRDRRHERAAGGRVDGAAVRADVLVAVRHGPGLRLQHDADQLGETALARDEPLLPGRALCRCRSSPTSSGARRRTRPRRSGGTSANDFRRLLGSRWYVNTTQDFLNSEEQGLDLRTTIGGGGGRYLMRSASQYLAVGGGMAWTNENYTDPTLPTKDSAEAYLGTEFMTEKLKITDLITRFTYYPSLTISDRYRLTYPVRPGLQPAGRLVFPVRVLRQLRQPAAAGILEERLRLVERVRLQVLRVVYLNVVTSLWNLGSSRRLS